jgi:hypothetical protein
MGKAQVSVEMVILLSALLILTMGIISSFASSSDRSFFSKRGMSAREFSEKLAYGINNVYLAGDGASADIVIPSTLIDNTNYSIVIFPSQHILEISWKASQDVERHQVQLLTAGLAGKLSGIYGSVGLSNVNGTIIITN